MFTPFVDLHTHTSVSDGKLPPRELVQEAMDAGIRVMSITDHNCSGDLSDLRAEFPEMTLIQGSEVSAEYHDSTNVKHDLHIIALGFDPENPEMKAMLAHNRPDRRPYIEAILKRLWEECGIWLGTYDQIREKFPDTEYIGRMVLAQLLVEGGWVATVDEAFDQYLGVHGARRAYVKNPLVYYSLEDTVRCIVRAGGIPVLAHLLYYDLESGGRNGPEERERLVRHFSQIVRDCGAVGGMEVYYNRYDTQIRLYLLQLCRKYGLLPSAGSDYHKQESWETLEHRLSCSACSDLLDQLGIRVPYAAEPAPLYVISGFSGVGKGTVCRLLAGKAPEGKPLSPIRSVTSRERRSDDDDYTFVTHEAFLELAANHELLEHNDAYSGNGYGTPVREVRAALESDGAPLLEINPTGLMRLLADGRINPRLIRSVFIVAPAQEVADRLTGRGTETTEKVLTRLETAIGETEFLHLYDAVVVSTTREQTAEDVMRALKGEAVTGYFDPAAFRDQMREIINTIRR